MGPLCWTPASSARWCRWVKGAWVKEEMLRCGAAESAQAVLDTSIVTKVVRCGAWWA